MDTPQELEQDMPMEYVQSTEVEASPVKFSLFDHSHMATRRLKVYSKRKFPSGCVSQGVKEEKRETAGVKLAGVHFVRTK
jgi:hypothetical protein